MEHPNYFDAGKWQEQQSSDDTLPKSSLSCAECGEPINPFERYFDFNDGAGPVCADCRVDYTDKFEHTA